MTSYIIETENLTKTFGSFTAVDHLCLKVPEGKIFGFLGPNGAGKSTTFKLLLGLVQPTGGHISVLGLPLKTHRLEILGKVGSMIDSPSFYGNLTALENLQIAARVLGLKAAEIERVLRLVDLWEFRNRKTRVFSMGMKQRLGIAEALLGNPPLLILDEPINGLDPSGIHEIRALIAGLPRESGVSVVLSSHLLSEVEQIADYIAVIQKGSLIYQGKLQELQTMSSPEILLDARPFEQAAEFLTRQGIPFEKRDHLIALRNLDEASLNKTLIHQGLDVYHLSRRQETLEEFFMRITRKEGAG